MIKEHRLQHFVDGSMNPPTKIVTAIDGQSQINLKFLEWQVVDQHILSCLFVAISDSIFPSVSHLTTAKEVWTSLEWKYSCLSKSSIF